MMSHVLRPFLETWHGDYRYWWEKQSNPRLPPMQRQREYPRLDDFLADWSAVRWLMRKVQNELVKVYKLADIGGAQKNAR